MPQIGPLELILLAVICAVAAAAIFSRKGRGAASGFVVGLVLGPIGVAIALVLDPRPDLSL